MIDYQWFMREFKTISNIDLTLYKEVQMQRRIDNFIIKQLNKVDYLKFLEILKDNKDLYEYFLEYLTINVTEFFRNTNSWNYLFENIIPDMINEKNLNSINIWSCGCSTGEEPYTLGILMKEFFPNIKTNILATDIDKKVISIAKQGLYNDSSMKNIPVPLKKKYFKEVTDTNTCKLMYSICDDIKTMITFKNHNLLNDTFPSNIDLIVCRNVIIYFKESTKIDLYKKFYNALSTNGYLFVGNTEHIVNYKDFNFSSINCFFFKKNQITERI